MAIAPLFAATSGSLLAAGETSAETTPPPVKSEPSKLPMLKLENVQTAVGQSHRSLAKVKELVDAYPLLANASWDWGGGDFETPLQAAAHTGQREIAEYLLTKHARLDLYAAAMLGHLEFVQAAFVANPRAHEIPGPHGFTLLHCAKQGGEPANEVYKWLIGRGASDLRRPLLLS